MRVVIRFAASEELKALPILLRHSPGSILPQRTYVVHEDAARALRSAGIRFSELSRELDTTPLEEVSTCERI